MNAGAGWVWDVSAKGVFAGAVPGPHGPDPGDSRGGGPGTPGFRHVHMRVHVCVLHVRVHVGQGHAATRMALTQQSA